MNKRYRLHNGIQRALCIGDDNTCHNLADFKGMEHGVRTYKTRCSKHRRPSHMPRSLNNPGSKRYIPMSECETCGSTETLERHRIKRGMPYTPKQVVVLCQSCHHIVHRFETIINGKNYFIKRTRVLKSRFEQAT